MSGQVWNGERILWLVFLVAAYFLIFMHLDWHPTYVWDEGLFANRAYYWAENGSYFTNWTEVPNCDLIHPNTKPPLMSIVQGMSLNLFGYSALALRIPIAITGLLTAIFMVLFMKKLTGKIYVGVLAGLVLLTCSGYNAIHVLKSGDHDVPLTWFLTMGWMALFAYLHSARRRHLFLLAFFVCIGLAVITKSIAGFMILPGVLVYLLINRSLPELLKSKWTYVGIVVFLVIAASFYVTTEIYKPGFLKLVWENEVNRYGKVIDNHSQPWYFYIKLLHERFSEWGLFIIFGLVGGFTSSNVLIKRLTLFLTVNALVFLGILSLASTKLEWYIAPIYPMLAILSAIGLKYLFVDLLAKDVMKHHPKLKYLGWALIVVITGYWTAEMVKDRYQPKDYWEVMEYERGLWQLKRDHPELKKFTVHTRREWYPNLIFIVNIFNDQFGYDINIINSSAEIGKGDLLYGFDHERFKKYDLEKTIDLGPIEVRTIFGKKE